MGKKFTVDEKTIMNTNISVPKTVRNNKDLHLRNKEGRRHIYDVHFDESKVDDFDPPRLDGYTYLVKS
jgi:hypothetical protein